MLVRLTCWPNLIIHRHRNDVTFSHSIWRRRNVLLINYLLILVFFAWPKTPYKWPYILYYIYFKILDRYNYWIFPINWTTDVHWKCFSEGKNLTTVLAMHILIYTKSIIWFVHSTYCTAFYMFSSSTDTGWWINLSQFFPFKILNKIWSLILFVLSKTSL